MIQIIFRMTRRHKEQAISLHFMEAVFRNSLPMAQRSRQAGTGIPRYTRSHFTRFRYNAI